MYNSSGKTNVTNAVINITTKLPLVFSICKYLNPKLVKNSTDEKIRILLKPANFSRVTATYAG